MPLIKKKKETQKATNRASKAHLWYNFDKIK